MIALAFVSLLLVSFLAGRRWATRAPESQAVVAGLLVWLAAFLTLTLHQAQSKFREQTTLIRQESDAVADLFRKLQTLPDANRSQLCSLLISYVDTKLGSNGQFSTKDTKSLQESQGIQRQFVVLIGELIRQKVLTETQSNRLQESVSQVIALHFHRAYAAEERMPGLALAALVLQSGMLAFLMGAQRNWLTGATFLILVTSMALLILDYERPHSGLIQLDTSNLRDVSNIMHHEEQL